LGAFFGEVVLAVVLVADLAFVDVGLDGVADFLEGEFMITDLEKEQNPHLTQTRSLSSIDIENRVARNAENGEGDSAPANCMCPSRVDVFSVVVSQVFVVDEREDENCLEIQSFLELQSFKASFKTPVKASVKASFKSFSNPSETP
jgi:hypothetical protein